MWNSCPEKIASANGNWDYHENEDLDKDQCAKEDPSDVDFITTKCEICKKGNVKCTYTTLLMLSHIYIFLFNLYRSEPWF